MEKEKTFEECARELRTYQDRPEPTTFEDLHEEAIGDLRLILQMLEKAKLKLEFTLVRELLTEMPNIIKLIEHQYHTRGIQNC